MSNIKMKVLGVMVIITAIWLVVTLSVDAWCGRKANGAQTLKEKWKYLDIRDTVVFVNKIVSSILFVVNMLACFIFRETM